VPAARLPIACGQPDRLHQPAGLVEAALLIPPEHRQGGQLRERVVTAARVHSDEHVFEAREVLEQPDVLEGARDAGCGDAIGAKTGDLVLLEPGLARFIGHVAGDHVHQRCLAGAVGADQALDRPFLHLQRHSVDGVHAAEVPLDLIQAKKHGLQSDAATTQAG